MVIDEQIKKDFKKWFNLDFEKYRHDGYSAICGKDKIDCFKMYDYLSRKFVIDTNMIECIEREYGKECREWYEKTFLNKS